MDAPTDTLAPKDAMTMILVACQALGWQVACMGDLNDELIEGLVIGTPAFISRCFMDDEGPEQGH